MTPTPETTIDLIDSLAVHRVAFDLIAASTRRQGGIAEIKPSSLFATAHDDAWCVSVGRFPSGMATVMMNGDFNEGEIATILTTVHQMVVRQESRS